MSNPADLLLDGDRRREAWAEAFGAIDAYLRTVAEGAVLPERGTDEIRAALAQFDFATPLSPREAIAAAANGLRRGQVHTSHPRYFGLFNPPATTMGIVGDALVAGFNPQLATHSHSPFPVEVEQHLLRAFGEKFGYGADAIEGTFTSGGAEANATAVLCALATKFPDWEKQGVRGLPGLPTLYVSEQAHHSLEKAARTAGLGDAAVRRVPTDAAMRVVPRALAAAIARDRGAGHSPFLVVGTCGTTSAGAIDPLAEVAAVAEKEELWFHVDAAWGGLAALVPELRDHVAAAARADSITFDAHKSLAVPMGAGMYISRRRGALERAFAVGAEYMPRGDADDPYARSLQWSRRFIGLKLFLSLAVAGWTGYEAALRHEVSLGQALRKKLVDAGWVVKNDTPLPIVCFVDGTRDDGQSGRFLGAMARDVAESAHAWISTTRIRGGMRVLRACITNPATRQSDVDALVEALGNARDTLPRA